MSPRPKLNSERPTPARAAPRVAVIGAGIAGLAAAYRIHEAAPDVSLTLYEATSSVGGIVQTVARQGFLIERSADSFITDPPHALDLCRRIGLADELIATSSVGRRALIVRQGKLVPLPEGFVIMSPRRLMPLLRSPLLSARGKLRVLEEAIVPPRSPYVEDESVAAFARRRFGDEAYERLIQPLVGGIYTGDPEKLSMAATMPRFWEAEIACGSVLRADQHDRRNAATEDEDATSGARYAKFVAPRRGMAALAEAVAEALPAETVRLDHRVTQIGRGPSGWEVTAANGPHTTRNVFDAVVIAVPAAAAADLVASHSPQLKEMIRGIESAGASIVCLGYRREQVAHPLDAFGFVVPQIEERRILAGSFLSNKFEGRAPQGDVLIRTFVGGVLQPELVDLPDDELVTLVMRELADLLGVHGPPQVVEIARWHGAMPQYHLGHLVRVEKIERLVASLPGLELAGNAYSGVGIAPCVRSGEEAAGRVLDFFHVERGR